MLARAASRFGFAGEYHILSSVVRSRDAFRQIATTMPRFHLTLTAECFDNRATVLKRSKADLTVADMRRVLGDAMEAGLKTDITYIVGLDACDRMLAGLTSLVGVINTFPRLQVFQAHNSLMDQFGTPGSEQLSFFLVLDALWRRSSPAHRFGRSPGKTIGRFGTIRLRARRLLRRAADHGRKRTSCGNVCTSSCSAGWH